MAASITVNGKTHSVEAMDDTPLLYVLRNDLELNGAKYGCGFAQCGACTVVVEGKAVRSCITPLAAVAGKQITTIEGLGTAAGPHPLQKAFVEPEQSSNCRCRLADRIPTQDQICIPATAAERCPGGRG